jgi:hypothetical protein
MPDLRPGWTEEVRKRAWKEAKLLVDKLRADVRRFETAAGAAADPKRKLILSSDVIILKRRLDDAVRELADLEKSAFRRRLKSHERQADAANSKRGAMVPGGGKPVQGGQPE